MPFYTIEKHTQILIALMKYHEVRKIVASPGATNICLVGSLQSDPYFEIYSSVDERSAAYIACGLARETGEPVALSCTGATASRNYVPGMTEAYYSNLPVLAITSTQHEGRIGQLFPQVLDRSNPMNDIVRKSIHVRQIHTGEDRWATEVAINDALLELRRHGGGPVHINLETTYSKDFSEMELPKVKGIQRYFYSDQLPKLERGKIEIYVGTHHRWSDELTEKVDEFCEKYDAVVNCEHISNYRGKYGVYPSLMASQEWYDSELRQPKLTIHLGGVNGAGASSGNRASAVWRVHPDGEARDVFHKLTKVFEMDELSFFKRYCEMTDTAGEMPYFQAYDAACGELETRVSELPFSNAWIARQTVSKLPAGCELHLGILNTLRTWSLFKIDPTKKIEIYSNTGGFGIDGLLSTLLGSALGDSSKLYIGVIGDLAFFYDMNALGNRHFPSNIRLMIVNNGRGTEFRNYNHLAANFGEDADPYMAAYGHYGRQSHELLQHYATDLGCRYLSASTKEEYLAQLGDFLTEQSDYPIVFEVFTDSQDESDALKILYNLEVSAKAMAKNTARKILGEKGVRTVKKVLGRE